MSRDPVAKTIVEAFTATYPHETDEQLYARIMRAAKSASNPNAEIPMTVQTVTYWRTQVTQVTP
ncbi:hypothetical protein [Actinoplanes sp. URMC 104]|uniref:hypothetical protein n=1 Tax=Actinoplanes sp. URMC 104 TaxID=3423409 RepID=UPI003F1E0DA1